MSVSLRLTRMGSKKRPFYRIVAIDSRSRRDGRYIELIGTYNPLTDEKNVNNELALKWLKFGAKPTEVVKTIFSEKGINKEFHDFKIENKKSNSKTTKPATKKTVAKPVAKKPAAKKPVAKKTETVKKTTTTKKPAAKKPEAKKPAAKKATTKTTKK